MWYSPDGLAWHLATDSPSFKNARVWGVAAGGPGLVAVGQTGPADAPGPAVILDLDRRANLDPGRGQPDVR